jgi:hypothetical protein
MWKDSKFFRAAKLVAEICGGWWGLMSGAFSIPFAFMSLFLPSGYHIVSQFKQRERVVIIDPAGDPEAVNPNSGKSQRDFDHPAQRCRVSGYAGSKVQPIVSTLKGLNQPPILNSTNDVCGIDATLSGLMIFLGC